MKYRMERLVLLPFSAGCVSDSAIGVAVHQPRRSKPDGDRQRTEREAEEEEEEEEESLSDESMKSSNRSLMEAIPKHYNISNGIHRFFKSFSQLFVEEEEEEEEKTEKEMEIGGPTNVKHVTHIGIDAPPNEDITMAGLHDLLMINVHSLNHGLHSLSAPSDLHDRDPLYPHPPTISSCPST